MSDKFQLGWLLAFVKKKLPLSDYEKFEATFPSELSSAWEYACSALKISMSELVNDVASAYSLSVAELPLDKPDIPAIPDSVLEKYRVIALEEDERSIRFATASPFDQEVFSILGFLTEKHIELAIANPIEIQQWLAEHISRHHMETVTSSSSIALKTSVIVRLVDKLLEQAIKKRASDIHIEPLINDGIVRFRIDGILQEITKLPQPVFKHVGQRIKAMSRLDVSNSLIPQDGQIHLVTNQSALDLRVSSVPVKGGEKFVLRLLKSNAVLPLDKQNFLAKELQQLKDLMELRQGILVMSGPTGSGKTTTLNSAIKEINSIDKCIVTIEDPVEYEIEGVAQIDVNPLKGLTFEKSIRHILRQDPDVILVGEVRDSETAETAIRAALTGHLVLTTLHTNDAVTVIPRLKDLGISDTLMADSLKALAAQRLLRKLCPHCAIKVESAKSKLEQEFVRVKGKQPVMQAQGCESCNNTGFLGRIPLLEILIIDEIIADAIRAGSDTKQLSKLAKQQGMRSLSDIATEHILMGSTTVEEAYRVLGKALFLEHG